MWLLFQLAALQEFEDHYHLPLESSPPVRHSFVLSLVVDSPHHLDCSLWTLPFVPVPLKMHQTLPTGSDHHRFGASAPHHSGS